MKTKRTKRTKPTIYSYTTEDETIFHFQVVKKDNKKASIIIEKTNELFNITLDELKKARKL